MELKMDGGEEEIEVWRERTSHGEMSGKGTDL